MAATKHVRWNFRDDDPHRHPAIAADLVEQIDELSGRLRKGPTLMPILLLTSDDEDLEPESTRLVEELYRVYRDGGLLCKRLPEEGFPSRLPEVAPDLSKYRDAMVMVESLAAAPRSAIGHVGGWDNHDRSQYKAYAFPRSRLLAAIENATVATEGTRTPEAVLEKLDELGWDRRRRLEQIWTKIRPWLNILVTLLGVLAVGTGILTLAAKLYQVAIGMGVVLVGFLVAYLLREALRPLGVLAAGSRWFANTTFVSTAEETGSARRPGRFGQARSDRARMVTAQLIAALGTDEEAAEGALQFYLRLRVHALLDDLRANHRPWALDLRRRKRTWPPMVFLPRDTAGGGRDAARAAARSDRGGEAFIEAVSDVRSRRSEADPLLVVSNLRPQAEVAQEEESRPQLLARYESWLGSVRLSQSPSQDTELPYAWNIEVTPERLDPVHDRIDAPLARRTWWLVWPSGVVALALVALVCAGWWTGFVPKVAHCGGLAPGLAWVQDQCVGIDLDGGTEFVPRDGGARLVAGDEGPGHGITLAELEDRIDEQNHIADDGTYVTIVYAGPLTTRPSDDKARQQIPLGTIRQVAGVLAYQTYVNGLDDSTKIRVLLANEGERATQARRVADRIAAAARRDDTIVGVVGLGTDTSELREAVKTLGRAGLSVVGTVNSDDHLGSLWNWFGLAVTNHEEAYALAPKARTAANRQALVLRQRGPDPYSEQQATAAEDMLSDEGFDVDTVAFTAGSITRADLAQVCRRDPKPSVVYLAGRSGQLGVLTGTFQPDRDCFADQVTVLTGDDVSNQRLTESPGDLPRDVTLYYTALTDTRQVAGDAGLDIRVRKALHLAGTPSYDSMLFADGKVALGHDAAYALYQATTGDGGGRQSAAAELRCATLSRGGATGPIGFNGGRHGYVVVKVPPGTSKGDRAIPEKAVPRRIQTCGPKVAGAAE